MALEKDTHLNESPVTKTEKKDDSRNYEQQTLERANTIASIKQQEKDDNDRENTKQDPDDDLFDTYVKLKLYDQGELTSTGVSNEFRNTQQKLTKGAIYRLIEAYNLPYGPNQEKQFQEALYNKMLSSPEGQKLLRSMWAEYGNTYEGQKQGIAKINPSDLTPEKLQELRKAFVDGKIGGRTLGLLRIVIVTETPPEKKPVPNKSETPKPNRGRFEERLFQPQYVSGFPSLTPVLADTYYTQDGLNIVFKANNTMDETPVQPTFTIKNVGDKTEFYLGDKLIVTAPKDKVNNFYSNIITGGTRTVRPYLFTENNIKKAVENYQKGSNIDAQQYLMYGNAADADNLLKKPTTIEGDVAKK